MRTLAWIGFVTLAAGCMAPAPTGAENPRLGIARFDVQETAGASTVIGRDADGNEVGRLELTHGPFTLSSGFAEGYDDPRVVGRRLEVRVLGQAMRWETEGFDATRHMPAHPPGQWAIAAFLGDPQVAPILDRWQIGFEAAQPEAAAGLPCHFNGSNLLDCSGQTSCPTVFNTAVPSTCGGLITSADAAGIVAVRVHQRKPPEGGANGYYYWLAADHPGIYDQSFIAQCCPATSTNPSAFYGEKSCPDAAGLSATTSYPSTCGAATPGKCKACAQYFTDLCTIHVSDAGWSDGDSPVYDVCAGICGDGICSAGEDCASCGADCGCTGFDTCGGGGTPGACGCTPASCPSGYQCGSIDDGCGGTTDCSGGLTCDEIVGKKHYVCDAASHQCCKHGRCRGEDDDD